MNARLRLAFDRELAAARSACASGDHDAGFHHLERAHILGQRHTWPHALVHWRMLRVGMLLRDRREVLGQVLRILTALIFTRIWVPRGNTGGANVNALKPMPVPQDLRDWLEE